MPIDVDPAKSGVCHLPLTAGSPLSAPAGLEVRTNLSGNEWDRNVCDFADVYYEQTNLIQGAQWGDRHVRKIAIAIDGRTVAMALALVFRIPIVGRGLAIIKYGPLWRRKGEVPDRQMLRLALDVLVEQFLFRERLSLSVLPPPDPRFEAIFREELGLRRFRHRSLRDGERFLVNATLTSERQLASVDQRWRRNLRRALKADLTIALERPGTCVADFAKLCMSMKERKDYSNPIWPLFENALSKSPATEMSPFVVLARENGVAVSGAIIFQTGDTAYYALGASSDRGVEIQAGYALHWWVVDWLRGRQCFWYDLGDATSQGGLRQFKKGFVGKAGTIAPSPGEFTVAPDSLGALAARLLLGARRMRLIVRVRIRDFRQLLRYQRRDKE